MLPIPQKNELFISKEPYPCLANGLFYSPQKTTSKMSGCKDITPAFNNLICFYHITDIFSSVPQQMQGSWTPFLFQQGKAELRLLQIYLPLGHWWFPKQIHGIQTADIICYIHQGTQSCYVHVIYTLHICFRKQWYLSTPPQSKSLSLPTKLWTCTSKQSWLCPHYRISFVICYNPMIIVSTVETVFLFLFFFLCMRLGKPQHLFLSHFSC